MDQLFKPGSQSGVSEIKADKKPLLIAFMALVSLVVVKIYLSKTINSESLKESLEESMSSILSSNLNQPCQFQLDSLRFAFPAKVYLNGMSAKCSSRSVLLGDLKGEGKLFSILFKRKTPLMVGVSGDSVDLNANLAVEITDLLDPLTYVVSHGDVQVSRLNLDLLDSFIKGPILGVIADGSLAGGLNGKVALRNLKSDKFEVKAQLKSIPFKFNFVSGRGKKDLNFKSFNFDFRIDRKGLTAEKDSIFKFENQSTINLRYHLNPSFRGNLDFKTVNSWREFFGVALSMGCSRQALRSMRQKRRPRFTVSVYKARMANCQVN